MATTTKKQPKFDATRPFYAAVGAGDLAIALARNGVEDVQARVGKVDLEPKALRDQALTLVNTRVEELQADAKKAQARFEARLAELQSDAKALPERVEKLIADYRAEVNRTLDELGKTYAELAGRGQDFVNRVRRQEATKQTKAAASTTAAKAKTTATQAKKAARTTTSSAKATRTAAKRTTTKATEAAADAAEKAGN